MAELAELQSIDTSMLDTIKADQGGKLFETAQKEYPYLSGKDIAYKYSPQQGRGFLEFYDPQETGSPEYPRPKELPLGKVGIEVFDPKTRPIDILADYVSHYGVEQDPYLTQQYQQFAGSMSPEQRQRLQQQYQYYQQHPEYKEQRPYQEWEKASGMPGYFRGYTFNQWDNPQEMYTPQQIQMLDQVRKYLGVVK
jgi:hypothetical protein